MHIIQRLKRFKHESIISVFYIKKVFRQCAKTYCNTQSKTVPERTKGKVSKNPTVLSMKIFFRNYISTHNAYITRLD